MKRFVFRLDAALKARQTILEARQADVLELTGRYDLATQLLAETEAKLAEHVKVTPKVGASFDPARELQNQRHRQQIREEVDRRRELVRQLTEHLEKAREILAEAYRDVRALEVLEERDRTTWALEMKREEQKLSDDSTAQRHGR